MRRCLYGVAFFLFGFLIVYMVVGIIAAHADLDATLGFGNTSLVMVGSGVVGGILFALVADRYDPQSSKRK